jgi:hypothetical protein
MITLLVVGPHDSVAAFAEPDPSVEILIASDLEDALEKLARNRRVDAVLLLGSPAEAEALARAIREEDPAGPPFFAPESAGPIPDVGRLPDGPLPLLAAEIARRLEP